MEEDPELRLINARKMAELRRMAGTAAAEKAKEAKDKEKTSREVLSEYLYDRGDEVLQEAYSHYPSQTPRVVDQLAEYLRKHPETGKISGGELFAVFRKVGLRFSLKTSIRVQEKGKFVDLKDKFRLDKGGEEEPES